MNQGTVAAFHGTIKIRNTQPSPLLFSLPLPSFFLSFWSFFPNSRFLLPVYASQILDQANVYESHQRGRWLREEDKQRQRNTADSTRALRAYAYLLSQPLHTGSISSRERLTQSSYSASGNHDHRQCTRVDVMAVYAIKSVPTCWELISKEISLLFSSILLPITLFGKSPIFP